MWISERRSYVGKRATRRAASSRVHPLGGASESYLPSTHCSASRPRFVATRRPSPAILTTEQGPGQHYHQRALAEQPSPRGRVYHHQQPLSSNMSSTFYSIPTSFVPLHGGSKISECRDGIKRRTGVSRAGNEGRGRILSPSSSYCVYGPGVETVVSVCRANCSRTESESKSASRDKRRGSNRLHWDLMQLVCFLNSGFKV
jgi:hypothetical protein